MDPIKISLEGESMGAAAAAAASAGQTRVAFALLDPILQGLLSVVTQYRQIIQHSTISSVQNSDIIDNEEMLLLSNSKSQIELISELEEALEQLGSPFGPSLVLLAEYISLPLTAIFHIGYGINDEHRTTSHNLSQANTRVYQIRTSYISKLHARAAQCIRTYVKLAIGRTGSLDDIDASNKLPTLSLPSKYSVGFLVALAKGFPINMDSISTSSTAGRLDDFSDEWCSILEAMDATIQVTSQETLAKAMDGCLVARLVDCSTSLLKEKEMISSKVVSLAALHVMQRLLMQVPKPDIWQAVFPGVFLALYRRITSSSRKPLTSQDVQIECLCLDQVGQLLRVTLRSIADSKSASTTLSNANILKKLQSLALDAKANTGTGTTAKEEIPTFLDRLKQRAAHLLVIILRQAVASRVPAIQLKLLTMCTAILIETTSCWDGTTVPEAALECCLVLQGQTDEEVANVALSIVTRYQDQTKTSDMAQILSRICSLIKEIPTLAQSARTLETKLRIQLVTGYLGATGNKGSTALATPNLSYQPLIQLMETDLSSTTAIGRSIRLLGDSPIQTPSRLPLKRLSTENANLARTMIQTLGKVLGCKQGAYTIDSLVVDYIETIAGKPSQSTLQEWSGSLVVARELLIGAFSENGDMDINSKSFRRRQRILFSLSTSIQPLLLDITSALHRPRGGTEWMPVYQEAIVSIEILSLELFSMFVELLGKEMDRILPSTIYLLVKKASNPQLDSTVQSAAIETIQAVSTACGFATLANFVRHESNHLLACLVCELRHSGATTMAKFSSTEETLNSTSTLTWVLDNAGKGDKVSEVSEESTVASIVQLGTTLIKRLDQSSLNNELVEDDIVHVTKLYAAVFQFWIAAFTGSPYGNVQQFILKEKRDSVKEPWLELLTDFQIPSEEEIQDVHKEEEEEQGEKIQESPLDSLKASAAEVDLAGELVSRLCYLLSNKSLLVQISACEVLTIGFNFLALIGSLEDADTEDSHIRNAILRQIATSWPSVKARIHNISDRAMDIKTITSLVVVGRTNNGTITRERDSATERFLLSRLFSLVASMAECSGDFLADRFKKTVWPILAKHLGHMMGQQEKAIAKENLIEEWSPNMELESKMNPYKRMTQRQFEWKDSERVFLLSILRSLTRVMRCDTGRALRGMLEAVGSIILPFLGEPDEEISACAFAALKSILDIDCDVLFRPLLELSGRGIPPFPLGNNQTNSSKNEVLVQESVPKSEKQSKLAVRCEELLVYIESLPEQTLL